MEQMNKCKGCEETRALKEELMKYLVHRKEYYVRFDRLRNSWIEKIKSLEKELESLKKENEKLRED